MRNGHDRAGAAEGPDGPGPSGADIAAERARAIWPGLQARARLLGFSQIAVADVNLADAEPGLAAWLAAGFHGDMGYLARHGTLRARPAELRPGTLRVVTARMDYLPRDAPGDWAAQALARSRQPHEAVVSVYAQGRDYHKVLRQRLQQLANWLAGEVGPFGHRVFTDSAPVLEVELASRSGLGWRGKHTLLLHREAGSMFFLGELFVDLPLPLTPADTAHCGQCSACMVACPTGAIVAPYRLDARRCISYLTIEHPGPIPTQWRAAIGNRIYGCDDCQLVCPWNKYAQRSALPDFDARGALARPGLLALWAWDETGFLQHTEGSAIRRIGFSRWRRNLAVALGNAWRDSGDPAIAAALGSALPDANDLVAEHITWALAQR
jgi:epoxyqueuosine reductase